MDWLAGSKAVEIGIACRRLSAIVVFNLLNSQPIVCNNNNLPAGTALAFATLFKLGQRSALLAPAARVFPHAVQLLGSRLAATNALARQACRWVAVTGACGRCCFCFVIRCR